MKKDILFIVTSIFVILNFISIITAQGYPILELGANGTSTTTPNYPIISLFKNITIINVNSSEYWDNLDSPSDIIGSEFWYNMTTASGDYNYNETSIIIDNYGQWFYNMTIGGGDYNYNETSIIIDNYGQWFYNMTIGGGGGVGLWATNGTSIYNETAVRLGIGTSSPAKTLTLVDTDPTIQLQRNSGTGANWTLEAYSLDGSFRLNYNNAPKFVLRNGGRIGLNGITSPQQDLVVNG